MRNMVLGNGAFGAGFDDLGRLVDLWWPGVGGENHLLGSVCQIGLEVDGALFWLDDAFECFQTPLQAGRSALTRWVHGPLGLAMRVEDELLDDGSGFVRRFGVDLAPGSKPGRLLLLHDISLKGSDLSNCVRYEPDGRYLHHFREDRHVGLFLNRSSGGGVEEWTLGRRDEEDGVGLAPKAARGELDRNPVAMGASVSLIAMPLEEVEGDDGRGELHLRFSDDAATLRGYAAEAAANPQAPPVFARAHREDPVRRLAREAPGFILSQQDEGGAIVASTDTDLIATARDSYAWSWPRDGAFAALALDRSGQKDAALRFFEFMARAKHTEGYLHQRYHVRGYEGSTWHQVHDPRSRLRPIQEDETALVLWAFTNSSHRENTALFDDLVRPLANFLVDYRDENTGLPLPSHDLWEERSGVHCFTTAAVIAALAGAAEVATTKNLPEDATRWGEAAAETERALLHHFWHEDLGRYVRTAHPRPDGDLHLDTVVDASLSGLFLFDPERVKNDRVVRTMAAVERELTVKSRVGGVARYAGDPYYARCRNEDDVPGNPWVLCTLWLAEYHILRAQSPQELVRADELLAWAASQAAEGNLLPEQVHPLTGEHLSVRPLTWSHAAFFLAAQARRRRRLEWET
ncbi:MAG TPA: glycoside hydrolase family 15 protein [Planctomycetes bacterium]|nr:glycoside hydrolase family 15 protein [Planctomycetota bacterium]